jgi:hypothetical protein
MLRLWSRIKIGSLTFKGVCEVEVNSSWDAQTDTCKITIPAKLSWQGKPIATGDDAILKSGMEVSVLLGYEYVDDVLMDEVFVGYIREIDSKVPVTITCEDLMYKLKRGEVTKSYAQVRLGQLIKETCPVPLGTIADADLGKFRITKATPSKVLDYLKQTYMIKSWCRKGKLNVGVAYLPEDQKTHRITFQRNVIEHDLEYRKREDVRLKLVGVIMDAKGKKEEVKEGHDDGELHTFNYHNRSKSEVEKELKKEAERLRYTGYRGKFVTFGAPYIKHGDVVVLSDQVYKEREGRYLVKAVNIRFGQQGYRQEVELESKL